MYRQLGIVPEAEAMNGGLTGWQFVLANARLHGLDDAPAAATRAIAAVDMASAQERDIATYSKGMRQRIKLATALVHDPRILLLDEPFNGMDPKQRLHLMDVLRTLASEGRSILFSSHILEEVEQLASTIEVLVAGRHAASGDFREIRRLMTQRPHAYVLRSSDDRALAAAVLAAGGVSAVDVDAPDAAAGIDGQVQLQVTDVEHFVRVLPRAARDAGITVHELRPADESLEHVFSYLVAR
jgi:ABC-2 type transport system ATP-binding protein